MARAGSHFNLKPDWAASAGLSGYKRYSRQAPAPSLKRLFVAPANKRLATTFSAPLAPNGSTLSEAPRLKSSQASQLVLSLEPFEGMPLGTWHYQI
jgi:hypothetical protein